MRTEFSSEAILTYVLCILEALDLWNFPQYCIVLNRVNESSRRGDVTAKAAAEWWTGAGSNHILKALPSKERENFVTVWKCLITRSEFGKSFKGSVSTAFAVWKYFSCINPRPAGPLDFPPPAGGGGGVWTPSPWSRLLVAVEKNKRKRSKAREKSFRNHFGHFLAQVKIEVTRGQNSKIFQNSFSTIKSLILKVEQRIWYHRVCLVKARRSIYKMTLKGQGQSLTSGQVRPRSRDDRNGSYCISLDLPGQDERTDTNPKSLSLFDQKLLANDGWWPRLTSNDLSRGRQCKFLHELSTTVLYDMIPIKYACAKVNITELIFCPLTYNGEVAKMTWPEGTDINDPRYTFCRHWWAYHILKVS